MDIALDENGKSVSLSVAITREQWQRIRHEQSFYCPICKEKVLLKLGLEKKWHFAHRTDSQCVNGSPLESKEHQNAKQLLYEWLSRYHNYVEQEAQVPSLPLRPDVFFQRFNQYYSFEIQRSAIDPIDFYSRHVTYLNNDIQPLWLGCKSQLRRKSECEFHFSSLDWLLLQTSLTSFPQQAIGYIDVQNKAIIQLSYPIPLAPNNIYAQPKVLHLNEHPFQEKLFLPSDDYHWNKICDHWKKQRHKWRTQTYRQLSRAESYMNEVYRSFLMNLNYFPSLCCFPIPSSIVIRTPPPLWQSWIVFKFLSKYRLHQVFTLDILIEQFLHCVKRNIFDIRPSLFETPHESLIRPFNDYLYCLEHVGFLEQVRPGQYVRRKKISICSDLEELVKEDEKVHNIYSREAFAKIMFRVSN
ncbi:competence protein CoiA [Texcoconibacillus texcoconensis]|uniref:Competence CoiA-like predicted nuclease n=1 Tax=Texcoconibacillus texcoconensis TaxID=1095777 RepID=A0A840QTY9_9BACI|nr:competence protein CoiA family protein [Texcoconibacillus texcoconensis]MBB5174845.1 competence CoiA-like predicted nuclease [Texcoconibacillus texcoconensis]